MDGQLTNPVAASLNRAFIHITSVIIPAYDAGLWNYLFEPVPNQTIGTESRLLRSAQLSDPANWNRMLRIILTEPVNQLDVFAWVTSNGIEPNEAVARVLDRPRQMLFVWLGLTALFVLALMLTISTLAIPCCCWTEECVCGSHENTTNAVDSTVAGRGRTGAYLARAPSYLDEHRIRTLSIGSVRAALHNTNGGPLGASSNRSTEFYVNEPTVVGRRGLPPGYDERHTPIDSRDQYYEQRNNSVDSLPLGSEARLCPMPRSNSKPTVGAKKPLVANKSRPNSAKWIHYSLLCFNIFGVIVLLVFYILTSYAIHHVYLYTRPADNPSGTVMNLRQTLNYVLNGIVSFLLETVDQGELATAGTLELLQGQVTDRLNVTAQRVIDQLLTAYHIASLFTSVDQLKPKVDTLMQSTAYIRDNHESVKHGLSSYAGELSAYTSLLTRALGELCAQLVNMPQHTTCLIHKSNAEQLTFTFDPTKVNADPSIALHVLMQQFDFNLTVILDSFDSASAGIDRMTEQVVQQIQANFRLEALLGDFLSIWKKFNTSVVTPLISDVEAARPLVQSNVDLASVLISLISFMILAVYLIALTIQITCLVFSMADMMDRQMYASSGIINVNSYTKPTIITTKSVESGRSIAWAMQVRVYSQNMLDRMHLPLRSISVLSGLLSLVACFLLAVLALLIPGTVLVQSEACRNFEGDLQRALTDTIMYRFMRHEWTSWLNNATVPPDILNLINIGPPTNLTQVVNSACDPAVNPANQIGLFGLVGHERQLNFRPLLEGDQVQTIIKDAENEFANQILQTDFTSYIPSNLNDLFSLAYNLTTYLDSAAYNESYNELSKQMLSVPNLSAYTKTVVEFLNTVPDSVYVQTVNDAIHLIDQSEPTLEQIQLDAVQLAQAFLNLTQNQQLTEYFEVLFTNLNSMITTVSDKQQLEVPIRPAFQTGIAGFLEEMQQFLIQYVDDYLDVLIPCGRLYQLYHELLMLTCEPDSLGNGLGALLLFLLISTFLLIVDLFLFVRFNARHQVQSYEVEHHLHWAKAVRLTHTEWKKQARHT